MAKALDKAGRMGRPPERRLEVLSDMRQRIVKGEYLPGSQIPGHRELERIYDASNGAIWGATRALMQEGFLRSESTRGTFVHPRPPHLCRYGLAMPYGTGGPFVPVSPFCALLESEGTTWAEANGRELAGYHGITGHSDVEDCQRLLGDLQHHRLAGLIYAEHPFAMGEPALRTRHNIPQVAVMQEDANFPDMTTVYPDHKRFVALAVQRLKQMGRSRLAMLAFTEIPGQFELFARTCAAAGVTHLPYWAQLLSAAPQSASLAIQLLLNPHQTLRPDGLVIVDDHLVPGVLGGLKAAGARLGDSVDVVAHCNWPEPPPAPREVVYLGFDARQIIKTCVEILDLLRSGERPPTATLIEPIFDPPRRSRSGSGRSGALCSA